VQVFRAYFNHGIRRIITAEDGILKTLSRKPPPSRGPTTTAIPRVAYFSPEAEAGLMDYGV